jgi:hypothetical protein
MMYLRGKFGVAQDKPKGVGLLEKAAEQGDAAAALELSRVHCMGLPQDQQAARGLWQKAVWRFEKDSSDEAKSICKAARLEAQELRRAARTGGIKTLERLSKTVVLAVELDSTGMTVLHIAASNGRLNVVEWLVAKGVGLDTATEAGTTALHFAARGGHTAVTEWLVAKGANVDSQGELGNTPLLMAAYSGHVAGMAILVANGADVAAVNVEGGTVVHLAAIGGDLAG